MAETENPSAPRRHGLLHWAMRLLVAFFALLVVIIAIAQIVLSSSIPRQIVIAQVQNALGLRITADQVWTGWFGHTTLRNVTVSLPMAQHAFMELPELRVNHTVLPLLLLTQSLVIKSIELDEPKVHITQTSDGRWNLQDVAALLAQAGNNHQTQPPKANSPLVLPRLILRDGQIDVTDNNGRRIDIAPMNVTGTPVNALVWQYDASCEIPAGPHISVSGRIAPNDNFSHEVDFSLSGLASLAKPWIANFDPNAALEGHWRGTKTADGVAGKLQLRSFRYQTLAAAHGDVTVNATGDSVTITPNQLVIQTDNPQFGSIAIAAGSLSIDATTVKVNTLQLSALNGPLLINAGFNFSDQTGTLRADWNALQPTAAFSSSGSIDATLGRSWPDQKLLNVSVSSTGIAADKDFNAHLNLTGGGKNWDSAAWTISAPALNWSGAQSIALDHLVAHLRTVPGQLILTDVNLPGSNTVTGGGGLRFDTINPSLEKYNWWLYLKGNNWQLPASASGASLAFGFNGWGDQNQIRLEQAYGIVGELYADAVGFYRMTQPRPVDLNLSLSELPAPIGNAAPIVQGRVRGEAVLAGTAYPLSLQMNGQLHGEQIAIKNRPLQRIDVKCTASVEGKQVKFDTETLSLLGGQWSLHGQYPAQENDHPNTPEINLRVADLPLENLGDLAQQKNITGIADGSLEVDIEQASLAKISAQGHFQARDIRARQFQAESLATNVLLHDGLLEIAPIELHQGTGQAKASLATHLNNPLLLTASLDATDWPIDAGAVRATASADARNLSVDAGARTASGQINFSTTAQFEDHPLLSADGNVGIAGRVLNLQSLNAKVLDGTASGSASFDVDHPLAARGSLRWDALNLSKLSSYNNIYATADGFITGRADLSPTTDPRALAPLSLDIATVGQSARFRSVGFTDLHLPFFFDADRVVLTGGRVDVAGGSIDLFARGSLHTGDALSAQIEATLNRLDLEQLFHAADKSEADKIKAFPGRLSGLVSVVGDPRDKLQLFGQASLQIHESDLANFGPFAALYNAMHLGGNAGQPIGEGTVEARYDNDSLIVSSLRYFNRGVDAYGLATIGNVSKYPACPVNGEIAGTLSPLRNIKLPFFADADKIFSVLQANLTSIVIGGTIEKPTYVPESVAAIGNAMRSFLLGDVTK